MTGRLLTCLLPLVVLCDGAYTKVCAQEPGPTDGPLVGILDCGKSPEAIRACGDAWLNECLKDWDASTHMSRAEYARTCERVAKERVKALIEDDAIAGRNVRPLGQ